MSFSLARFPDSRFSQFIRAMNQRNKKFPDFFREKLASRRWRRRFLFFAILPQSSIKRIDGNTGTQSNKMAFARARRRKAIIIGAVDKRLISILCAGLLNIFIYYFLSLSLLSALLIRAWPIITRGGRGAIVHIYISPSDKRGSAVASSIADKVKDSLPRRR